jgi:hypothetical protein
MRGSVGVAPVTGGQRRDGGAHGARGIQLRRHVGGRNVHGPGVHERDPRGVILARPELGLRPRAVAVRAVVGAKGELRATCRRRAAHRATRLQRPKGGES